MTKKDKTLKDKAGAIGGTFMHLALGLTDLHGQRQAYMAQLEELAKTNQLLLQERKAPEMPKWVKKSGEPAAKPAHTMPKDLLEGMSEAYMQGKEIPRKKKSIDNQNNKTMSTAKDKAALIRQNANDITKKADAIQKKLSDAKSDNKKKDTIIKKLEKGTTTSSNDLNKKRLLDMKPANLPKKETRLDKFKENKPGNPTKQDVKEAFNINKKDMLGDSTNKKGPDKPGAPKPKFR
ncbi:hypothetical protein DLD77_05070 [Chitinophaga alhagiae]|uniref:Uncharacterized protein n=1 Tax=Chitinophaga alhagiae TaxID=2203219 RepID=A0ABM6WB64_9BACT|nr:hypothetical protein [Chitinophaga alhagiae]AWO01111.1 hypothetical protein DLD77_05070 [Chitinophaga alhagiae]